MSIFDCQKGDSVYIAYKDGFSQRSASGIVEEIDETNVILRDDTTRRGKLICIGLDKIYYFFER